MKFLERMEGIEDRRDGELLLLDESNIAGASLNGKSSSELNIAQLKQWLACRGAPVSGKKPELIER